MSPTPAQRAWMHDVLQVIQLTDHQQTEEVTRKDSLRADIATGLSEIDDQVALMTLAVRTFFTAYRQGLNTFGVAMLDVEMDEKEAASAADIIFKVFAVLSVAFPEVLLAEKLGEGAASAIKDITEIALEEGREAIKGAPTPPERTFGAFAKTLGDASVDHGASLEAAVLKGAKSVKKAYGQMAMVAGTTTEGPAATFLAIMATVSQSFDARLKAASDPNKLEALFAIEFAGKAGKTPIRVSVLDPTRDAGTLYFEITTVTDSRALHPDFVLGGDTDKKWKLVMLGGKADAKGAARALKESVRTPWKIPLPRRVRIDIYDQLNARDRHMFGGWLVFGKDNAGITPDNIENEGDSKRWLMLAWANSKVQSAAVSNEDLEGAVD